MNQGDTCAVCGGAKKHPQMIKGGLLSYTCVDWFHAIAVVDYHLFQLVVLVSDGTDDPNLYLGNLK